MQKPEWPRSPEPPTIMEKVAAIAVLTAIAVVVALVLGFIVMVSLSSDVRAGEPTPVETPVSVNPAETPLVNPAPTPTAIPTSPSLGNVDPICLVSDCTLPDTAMVKP